MLLWFRQIIVKPLKQSEPVGWPIFPKSAPIFHWNDNNKQKLKKFFSTIIVLDN